MLQRLCALLTTVVLVLPSLARAQSSPWIRVGANGVLLYTFADPVPRTLDPFRSIRPHFENSILGTTRWTIHTLGYGYRLGDSSTRLGALPFVEVSYGRMADTGGGVFDVRSFYGRDSFWSLEIGLRLSPGMRMHRMGRYRVAQDTAASGGMEYDDHHEH
ncbi:MAG: hypothetical protein ABI037_00920 [Gemmatimonadales bacterium]